MSKCSPTLKVKDLYDWWDASELPASVTEDPSNTLANPCGNIAKYQFTDEFYEITDVKSQKTYEIDDSDIVGSHEFIKFKINQDVAENGGYWTNTIDPHLIVWFQPETQSNVQKLYGKIDGTLKAGTTYEVKMRLQFDNEPLATNKYLLL